MKHLLLTIISLLLFVPSLSADDYYRKKAESYQREAEYYQKRADNYRREAQYYLDRANARRPTTRSGATPTVRKHK